MKGNDFQLLEYIAEYCRQVKEAIDLFGEDRTAFFSNAVYRNAVSMPIFQIGELAKRLTPEFRALTDRDFQWKQIAGMRDRYAHGYSDMNLNYIWLTATQDIPALQDKCSKALENARAQDSPDSSGPAGEKV